MTKEQAEAHVMAVRTIRKQPEKNSQRDPGEKGWACYYCGKEGHLKQDCPQASKPPCSMSSLQGTTEEERLPPEAQVSGVGLSRQSGLKVPGVPTQAAVLITSEETPSIDNCGGPIRRFPFAHWGNLLCAY